VSLVRILLKQVMNKIITSIYPRQCYSTSASGAEQTTLKEIQVVVIAELEPRTAGLRVRQPNLTATLPPPHLAGQLSCQSCGYLPRRGVASSYVVICVSPSVHHLQTLDIESSARRRTSLLKSYMDDNRNKTFWINGPKCDEFK